MKRKALYQKRLVKGRIIVEKLQKIIANIETRILYNPDSKILVSNNLFSNCDISIGGGPIKVKADMAGIAILARKKAGNKIVPYDVGLRLIEQEDQDQADEDKKAS